MLFKDRVDAGEKLLPLLKKYQGDKNLIVLGLPRGGVVVAAVIAKGLNAPLDIIVTRKIGAPLNPELAIGAVTQSGECLLNEDLVKVLHVKKDYIDSEIEKEKQEAQRRVQLYRKNHPPLKLEDKTVILVDDGIATGATILSAIKSVKTMQAKKIIIASPVASQESAKKIKSQVEEFICLDTPEYFGAIGNFYSSFPQVEDDEVIELLSR